MGDSLDDLIRRAAAGGEDAFTRLHDRFARFVREQIQRRLGADDPAADDMAQEVWIQVLRGLPSYDSTRATFVRWLTVIAVRTALSELRRRGRRQAADERLQAQAADPPSVEATPAESVVQAERLLAIRRCAEQLAGTQREAFVLVRLLNLDTAQAADALKISTGRVRGALSEAHRSILECLERNGLW